jgi:hypothetical protein
MKRFLVVFAALFLIIGLAGQAHAYFSQNSGDLIRVVEDVTSTTGNGTVATVEQATDLGSAAYIMANPGVLTGSGYSISGTNYTDTFNLFTSINGSGNFSTTNSNLYVAYFAVNNTGGYQFWTSGTATGTETNLTAGTTYVNQVGPNANNILGQSGRNGYNVSPYLSGSNLWYLTSNTQSYWRDMDGNQLTYQGAFDKFYLNGKGDGDASIALGGSATQGLFYWNPANTVTTEGASLILTTTIDSNGNIVTTASAVQSATTPIPPSVLLFGSGLLGLIGIGRKNLFKS